MSFLNWIQDWKVGGAITALLLPLVLLQTVAKAPNLSITGWTKNQVNGFYSRVRLFIKNSGQASGGGNALASQPLNTEGTSQNIPDLIAEIPLDKLGRRDNYKFCLPKNSNLKTKPSVEKVDKANISSCTLKLVSEGIEELNSETLNYLLDLTTKYIQVQHAANMVLFYDSNVNFSGASTRLKKIASSCGLSFQSEKEILKEIFFQSTKSSKQCLPSPTSAELTLRLPSSNSISPFTVSEGQSEGNKLDKTKLSQGNLFGYLKYGIFDYWTTNLVQISKNGGSEKKGKSIKVNWLVNFSLSESTLEKCSLESFYKGVLKQELKFEKLSNCAFSAK